MRKKNLPGSWSKTQKEQEMNVPQWLLNLTYKCLEKLPENRYANGMELHDAIIQHSIANIKLDDSPKIDETIIQQEPETVADPANAYPTDQSDMIRLSKPVFTLLMLALVGFMGYTAYSLLNINKPDTQKPAVSSPLIDSAAYTDSIAKVQRLTRFIAKKTGSLIPS
ncbi:hypothetical protein [Mucilaginibacter humi]|uniref:hypothetical protein n=1 Tax=Mucilaginibacter humi TaxID=2732510 RepID=UPI001C2EA631|nr:hypothetical protein [Mucilaginibacter humi]